MEAKAAAFDNFVFGNILTDEIDAMAARAHFRRAADDSPPAPRACRATCRYFAVCGGGSPVNKLCERGVLSAAETNYCRLSIQAAADALSQFIAGSGARSLPAAEEEFA